MRRRPSTRGFVHHDGLVVLSLVALWIGVLLPSITYFRKHEWGTAMSIVLGVASATTIAVLLLGLLAMFMYVIIRFSDRVRKDGRR